MNFTYKIENYIPSESRLFVIYTSEDTTKDPMGGWVIITPAMTEAEIETAIIQQCPYYRWDIIASPIAEALVGHTGAGSKPPEPTPEPTPELTVEQINEQLRAQAKIVRGEAVRTITVTTTAGNTFDGDEMSQTRMARAILALQGTNTPSTLWVLADNTTIQATVAELTEALALAGAAQSAIWVL